MSNYNIQLQSIGADLQEVLQSLQNKAAGSITLPNLTSPAQDSEIFLGKEVIDQSGKIQTGTFTIADELASQETLIAQLQNMVDELLKAGGEQTTPVIHISNNGLITATAGDKVTTEQLTTQAAQIIIPGTSDQTILAGRYLTGTQTIKGDANLIPMNIVSGKSIFGVSGSAEIGNGSSDGGSSTSSNCNCHMCVYVNNQFPTPEEAELIHVIRNGNIFTIRYSGTTHNFFGIELLLEQDRGMIEGEQYDYIDDDGYSFVIIEIYPEELDPPRFYFNAIID